MTQLPIQVAADWNTTDLAPSGSWDGTTSWSGRTVPTESASVHGSGWAQKAIGNFDTPPFLWYTDETYVGVVAEHGDADWIDHVEFWLEGATATVRRVAYNPDSGAIGWFVRLRPPAGVDGDAHLYARIVPVNGYERLVGPLQCILNGGGSIARTVKTVKASGGDYATIRQASDAAQDGWIVKVDAGTWQEDPNGVAYGGAALARGFEIRAADGLGATQVVITRSSRGPLRAFSRPKTVFRGVTFDSANINTFYDGDLRVCIGCRFVDSNGVNPAPGYQINDLSTFFRGAEGQQTYIDGCHFAQPQCAGWKFMRNSTGLFSADFGTIRSETNNWRDFVVINTVAEEAGNYAGRRHVPSTLTVATVSYSAGTGRTTVTFSGSPSMDDVASATSDDKVFVLSGALAGQTFQLYTQTNSTDTVVLTGDASALVAGDTLWTGNLYHCDTFQTFGNSTSEDYQNLICQRYRTSGAHTQGFFLQTSNGSATQKDIAFQLCIFDCGALSQIQNRVQNVVLRQCSHVGSNLDLRNDMSYWNAVDCVIDGCLLAGLEMTSGGGTVVSGFTVRDCHFVSWSTWSSPGASSGNALLDAKYRPGAGSPAAAGVETRFPFDYHLRRTAGSVAKGACA